MSAFPQPASQRGFTLIELLVVMVLLAMLMTGLILAMRTMAQTETRVDQRLQRLDDLRAVQAFLSQALDKVSGARIDAPNASGKVLVPFFATQDSLVWIGALPARPGAGGSHYFRLMVEGEGDQRALVLRLSPCGADRKPPQWANADAHLLMRDVSRLTIQAQGGPPSTQFKEAAWPTGWQRGWPVADNLPEQVMVSIADAADVEIASWTFALHAFAQSDGTISRVSVGGATP